jgi:hypothetical protein
VTHGRHSISSEPRLVSRHGVIALTAPVSSNSMSLCIKLHPRAAWWCASAHAFITAAACLRPCTGCSGSLAPHLPPSDNTTHAHTHAYTHTRTHAHTHADSILLPSLPHHHRHGTPLSVPLSPPFSSDAFSRVPAAPVRTMRRSDHDASPLNQPTPECDLVTAK